MPSNSKDYSRNYYLAHGKKMRDQMRAVYEKKTYGQALTVPEYNDVFADENIAKYWEGRGRQTDKIEGACQHNLIETPTLDGNGNEFVCDKCGEAPEIEIDEPVKLSGCMALEDFLKVCYGPATPVYLESFLVPTLRRIACRDRYLDIKILSKLRTYTAIIRVCEQYGIPRMYADDTMRLLLIRKKGLYSKYIPIKVLMEVMSKEPRLARRVQEIEHLSRRT